jgi:hypothetical protein
MTRIAHKVPIIQRSLKSIPEPLHRVQPVEVASKGSSAGSRSGRAESPSALGELDGHLERTRPADRVDRRPRPALRPNWKQAPPRRSRRRRGGGRQMSPEMALPAPMETIQPGPRGGDHRRRLGGSAWPRR